MDYQITVKNMETNKEGTCIFRAENEPYYKEAYLPIIVEKIIEAINNKEE